MSRVLKLSGFAGLTVQMLWGMVNIVNLIAGTPVPSEVMRGAHAHFGVLSIVAVVAGFALERYELAGTRRTVTVWGAVAGQWLLPAAVLAETVSRVAQLTAFLWGLLLLASMASITWAVHEQA